MRKFPIALAGRNRGLTVTTERLLGWPGSQLFELAEVCAQERERPSALASESTIPEN